MLILFALINIVMSESSKEESDLRQKAEDIAEELSQEDGIDSCVVFNNADEAIRHLEAEVAKAIKYFEARVEEKSELSRLREEFRRRLGIFTKNSA